MIVAAEKDKGLLTIVGAAFFYDSVGILVPDLIDELNRIVSIMGRAAYDAYDAELGDRDLEDDPDPGWFFEPVALKHLSYASPLTIVLTFAWPVITVGGFVLSGWAAGALRRLAAAFEAVYGVTVEIRQAERILRHDAREEAEDVLAHEIRMQVLEYQKRRMQDAFDIPNSELAQAIQRIVLGDPDELASEARKVARSDPEDDDE